MEPRPVRVAGPHHTHRKRLRGQGETKGKRCPLSTDPLLRALCERATMVCAAQDRGRLTQPGGGLDVNVEELIAKSTNPRLEVYKTPGYARAHVQTNMLVFESHSCALAQVSD